MTKTAHIHQQLNVLHKMKALNRFRSKRFFLVLSFCCLTLVAVLGTLLLMAKPQEISASTLNEDTPTLTAISPTEAYNWQPKTVTITGTGFFTVTGTGLIVPTAHLDNVPLTDVTFLISTTLTATVPADLPGGTYTLKVTNPDSQSASLSDAFTVLLSGDGSLGPWHTTT